MTVTLDLPDIVYVTTEITTKAIFRTTGRSRPVDPTTVMLTILDGNGEETVWTYGGTGSITRSSQGLYQAPVYLDVPGGWSLKWVGTGACAVPGVVSFTVTPLPF
jgi:hypothetical protein